MHSAPFSSSATSHRAHFAARDIGSAVSTARRWRGLAGRMLLLWCCVLALPVASLRADYTWTSTSLYNGTHPPHGAWTTDYVPGPDGTGQSIQVTIPTGSTYYNFIDTPRTYLNANITQFRAVLSFRVATPTAFPRYFYMFARCVGASGTPEIWQRFVAEPADGARTIELPLDLKPVAGGAWHVYVGCFGTGSIIIDSYVIKDGWGLTTQPPQLNATAASTLPAGVTLATGSPVITVNGPAAGTVTVLTPANLIADGASPVSSATAAANVTALRNVLTTARNTAGTKKIVIPAGTYRFESSSQIDILNTNDLTIDGQGSDFIFQKLFTGPFFAVSTCNRVVIKNLNLDWNWAYKPIASLGKVLSFTKTTNPDKTTAVMEFTGQTAAQTLLTRSSLWYGMYPMDPIKLYKDKPESWRLDNNAPTLGTPNGNQITVTFNGNLALEVNRSYCVKHLYYEMCGFKLASCSHLTFDTINIYSLPGMGWLNTNMSHHLKWANCKFVRRTGSTYPLVTGADGIHSGESQGDLVIQNCAFTGLGDDAINLHDNCWQGGLVYGATGSQLKFLNCPRHQLRLESGDVVRFFNADYSPAGIDLTVSGTPTYTAPAGGDVESATATTTINFTTPAPTGLSNLLIAINTKFNTKEVKIAGCQFTWLNGRAILLSAQDATIDSCYFRNVSSTSLQVNTEIVDTAYMEGRGASNLLVKSNTFENTNQSGRWDGAVIHVGPTIPWGPADYPLFDTMLFDGNRFYNTPGPAMSFVSSQNVVVRNSRIEYNQTMFNITPFSGTLEAVLSEDMALGGNTWANWITPPNPTGVVYAPGNTGNIEFLTNRLENNY